MKHYSFYRPQLLLLVPCTTFQLAAAFALFVGVQLQQLGPLILAAGLVALSVFWNCAWSGVRYDFYGVTTYNERSLSPMLVMRTGWLSQNEEYVPLTFLSRIAIHRPLCWKWCKGSYIKLYFVNGDTLDLKLVSAAENRIARLCADLILPQSPPVAVVADRSSLRESYTRG